MLATSHQQNTALRPGSLAIGQQNGRVLMHFDRPVSWAGFQADEAMKVARDLMDAAAAAGFEQPNQSPLF